MGYTTKTGVVYYFADRTYHYYRLTEFRSFNDFVWDNPYLLFVETIGFKYKVEMWRGEFNVDFRQAISDIIAGECCCAHCGEPYEAFPTFEIFSLHMNQCAQTAAEIVKEKINNAAVIK